MALDHADGLCKPSPKKYENSAWVMGYDIWQSDGTMSVGQPVDFMGLLLNYVSCSFSTDDKLEQVYFSFVNKGIRAVEQGGEHRKRQPLYQSLYKT